MNCAPGVPTNIFSIFTGDAKTMNLSAYEQNPFGPLDLTAASDIVVMLPNADGSFLSLNLAAGVTITAPSILGNFTADITSMQSALLNIGEFQNFDVTFTINAKPVTIRYYGLLSVFELD